MRIAFQLLFRAPIRSDLDAEIDRPDLISFEAEIDVIRAAVPYLSKRVMHERALAGLTFITLQVAERARIIDDEPGEPSLDEEAFIANLVDMTTALLTAPAFAAQTAVSADRPQMQSARSGSRRAGCRRRASSRRCRRRRTRSSRRRTARRVRGGTRRARRSPPASPGGRSAP